MRTSCSKPRSDKPPVRPLTRHEKARIFHWIRAVEELVRSGPLVRGDECLAKAIIDYPSVAAVGWTWPGELRLAAALNESDRNIRKRERRLRALGMLVVVAPSEGWRSNRYVPILANRPLFESALGSAKVRAAISAQCGEDHGPTIAAPESVESGTLVPPREEPPFHSERNERSADSRGETLQENISPTLYSSLSPFQWKEEAFDFPQMDQAVRPGAAATPSDEVPADRRTEDLKDQKPKLSQDHQKPQSGAAPVVEISFARVLHDYPHPPGSLEHPAYRPSARKAWNQLKAEQQQAAAQTASNAPGKQWLKYWLKDGVETGVFEVVERRPISRVWVREGTPQWTAWEGHHRANGQRPLRTQRKVGGELQTGWMFESERPPAVEHAPSPEVCDE
jgi:hypothetical protein